jgi:signal transduction histidine kinase
MSGRSPPSIRGRLATALLLWSVIWGLGVALAVGLAAQKEVDELLDESLHETAVVLARAVGDSAVPDAGAGTGPAVRLTEDAEFAWQVVDTDGTVRRRSANAPVEPLQPRATAGLSQSGKWRVFGLATGPEGRMLYVAHTHSERAEARLEVATGAALAALSFGLLGAWWLRARVRQELTPVERLSERLAHHDPLDTEQALGPAERAELVPVHAAIDELGRRLASRIAHERAFSAHAAHALRTPLAGMDAQLAVALRESPPGLQQRLQRVRDASGRLQRVVQSLLDLFRAGSEAKRVPIDLKSLLAHLPVEGIELVVEGESTLVADPDLLAAALSNLLDNTRRHGGRRVRVELLPGNKLRLQDDGPGMDPVRRSALRGALARQDYQAPAGLGLMLVDLVARAHGGALTLPETPSGFAVELDLASIVQAV